MDSEVLEREVERQHRIFSGLPICADILRADIYFYELPAPESPTATVAEHAQPHSVPSLALRNRKFETIALNSEPELMRALAGASNDEVDVRLGGGAVQLHVEYISVRDRHHAVMGVVGIQTSAGERSRQRAIKNDHYRRAMTLLKRLATGPGLPSADRLDAFTARDGLVVLDGERRVRYVSGVAEGLYAKINLTTVPLDRRIESLETGDDAIVWQAIREQSCIVAEGPARDCTWIRSAIPLASPGAQGARHGWRRAADDAPPEYVLLLLRDVTDERRRAEELEALANISREIHHRVKNNLQTLISHARMAAREARSEETRTAMTDLINRMFAIEKIHEYLTVSGSQLIDVKEVCRQIAEQMRIAILPATTCINIDIEGDALMLPPKQATMCALIVNELMQNSIEHAFDEAGGTVRVELEDGDDQVHVAVIDDGRGFPPGFEWRHAPSYGLKIVNGLARDLRGELKLANVPPPGRGLAARLTLSRHIPGGK